MAAPSIFGDQAAALAALRRDRLLTVAQTWFPDAELTDEYLWSKLRAAEADAQRRLRTWFSPRLIVTHDTTDADRAKFRQGEEPVAEEPGYDFDPSLFAAGAWGMMRLRQRPIVKVLRMRFIYPGTQESLFDVPIHWLRIDKKYATVQLVPVGSYVQGQLGGFVISSVGFAGSMPLAVQVVYRAGLENAAEDYPDLLDLLKKMAVLSILDDQYLPSSGSISADGLSQSLSFDASKYHDQIEQKVERLRQSIGGVTMGIL